MSMNRRSFLESSALGLAAIAAGASEGRSALAGKNQMPKQGGGDFSEVEIGRAVVYMANKSGAKFAEPAAPAAAASGASAPAAAASAAK